MGLLDRACNQVHDGVGRIVPSRWRHLRPNLVPPTGGPGSYDPDGEVIRSHVTTIIYLWERELSRGHPDMERPLLLPEAYELASATFHLWWPHEEGPRVRRIDHSWLLGMYRREEHLISLTAEGVTPSTVVHEAVHAALAWDETKPRGHDATFAGTLALAWERLLPDFRRAEALELLGSTCLLLDADTVDAFALRPAWSSIGPAASPVVNRP